jgi:sigma-B regulation protein RsbU (phosphoserine phosphatase)
MKTERLQAQLQQRDFKLKSLLEITKAINNNLTTSELLGNYRDIVENQLLIPRLVLFSYADEEWSCVLQYGIEKKYRHNDVHEVFATISEIITTQSVETAVLKDFDLVIPVFHNQSALSFLLIGDINDDTNQVSPIIKHMRFLQTLTNIISVAIENKKLFSRSLEQERINTELALAAEMQALLVGSGVREYPHFDVATFYKPHLQVGGDFCDFIEFNEDEAFFCVADVSGKGVSAAFLMANVQAQLRALLEHTNWTLPSLAIELNKRVMHLVKGERFVTLFMGYFHRPSRKLQYLNAGHNPAVLYSDGKIHNLNEGSVGIGMLQELPFINTGEHKLGFDATVICYTDGVIEIENENEEEFGHDRLGDILVDFSANPADIGSLINQITEAIDKHRGANPYFDDTALLCCRFK